MIAQQLRDIPPYYRLVVPMQIAMGFQIQMMHVLIPTLRLAMTPMVMVALMAKTLSLMMLQSTPIPMTMESATIVTLSL